MSDFPTNSRNKQRKKEEKNKKQLPLLKKVSRAQIANLDMRGDDNKYRYRTL